jgi:molecular chaperone GrpE (heat shock protein)
MQIRVRNNGKVEFLRAVYDSAAKRTRQVSVREDELTEQEKIHYEIWRKRRDDEDKALDMFTVLLNSVDRITDITEAIAAGIQLQDPAGLLAALDKLNKVLRKNGVKRPPRTSKPVVDTKTANLLENAS